MIRIVKGESKVIQVPVMRVSSGNLAETEMDVSAATEIKWILAASPTSTTAVLTKLKSTNGVTFDTDGKDGLVNVAISDTESKALNAGLLFSIVSACLTMLLAVLDDKI